MWSHDEKDSVSRHRKGSEGPDWSMCLYRPQERTRSMDARVVRLLTAARTDSCPHGPCKEKEKGRKERQPQNFRFSPVRDDWSRSFGITPEIPLSQYKAQIWNSLILALHKEIRVDIYRAIECLSCRLVTHLMLVRFITQFMRVKSEPAHQSSFLRTRTLHGQVEVPCLATHTHIFQHCYFILMLPYVLFWLQQEARTDQMTTISKRRFGNNSFLPHPAH